MNVSTSSTYIQLQNANECKWDFMLDASTIQPVQLQNANEILCWMLQLTQHIQLQNENDDLKGINYKNDSKYKMGGTTPPVCTKKFWLAICTVAQVLPIS